MTYLPESTVAETYCIVLVYDQI